MISLTCRHNMSGIPPTLPPRPLDASFEMITDCKCSSHVRQNYTHIYLQCAIHCSQELHKVLINLTFGRLYNDKTIKSITSSGNTGLRNDKFCGKLSNLGHDNNGTKTSLLWFYKIMSCYFKLTGQMYLLTLVVKIGCLCKQLHGQP